MRACSGQDGLAYSFYGGDDAQPEPGATGMKHGEVLMVNGTMLCGGSDGRGVRLSPERTTVEPPRGPAQGCATSFALPWQNGHEAHWPALFVFLWLTISGDLAGSIQRPGKINELSTSGMFIDARTSGGPGSGRCRDP